MKQHLYLASRNAVEQAGPGKATDAKADPSIAALLSRRGGLLGVGIYPEGDPFINRWYSKRRRWESTNSTTEAPMDLISWFLLPTMIDRRTDA